MSSRYLIMLTSIASIVFLSSATTVQARQALWRCDTEKVKTAQDFCELCMELWTKIDLVQAINTSGDLKKRVLKEIQKDIARLYRSSSILKKKMYRSPRTQLENPILLAMTVKEALEEVFSENREEHFVASLSMLNRLMDELITPVHIDAQVTA